LKTPTILGQPLWYGKVKSRVAKKHLRRSYGAWMFSPEVQKEMSQLNVGDFINDCSGFNRRIKEIQPYYIKVSKGFVLSDIDITNDMGGSCSLRSCGVQGKLSREQIEKDTVRFLRNYTLGDDGKYWFGGEDSEEYKKAAIAAQLKISIIESGGHIADEDGQRLDIF
jgi:hypothetical protein